MDIVNFVSKIRDNLRVDSIMFLNLFLFIRESL